MRRLADRRLSQRVLGGRAPYAGTVLADQPLFYYRFEERSGGVVADSTPNGNNGIVSGADLDVEGRVGSAVSFDGQDDYVTGVVLGDVTAATVECWVKVPDGVGGGTGSTNIWGVIDASSSNIIQLAVSSGGNLILQERTDGGSPVNTTSSNAWDDDEWHHVVAIIQQAAPRRQIWVDGVLDGGDGNAHAGTWNLSTTPISFGSRNDRGTPLTFIECLVDEAAVYDKALDPLRIVAHFEAAP